MQAAEVGLACGHLLFVLTAVLGTWLLALCSRRGFDAPSSAGTEDGLNAFPILRDGTAQTVSSAACLAHVVVSQGVVWRSHQKGFFSEPFGLHWQGYLFVFFYWSCWSLVQALGIYLLRARPPHSSLPRGAFLERYALSTLPFFSDFADVVRDALFSGFCFKGGGSFLNILGLVGSLCSFGIRFYHLNTTELFARCLSDSYLRIYLVRWVDEINVRLNCSMWVQSTFFPVVSTTNVHMRQALDLPFCALGLMYSLYCRLQLGHSVRLILIICVVFPLSRLALAYLVHDPLLASIACWLVRQARVETKAGDTVRANEIMDALVVDECALLQTAFERDEEETWAIACLGLPDESLLTLERLRDGDADVERAFLSKLGDAGAFALWWAMSRNEVVTLLDVRFADVGYHGGAAIASAVAEHPRATSLIMSGNSLGRPCGAWLARALHVSTTLSELVVSGCSLDEEGSSALFRAIRLRISLRRLVLDANILGRDSGERLAEALSSEGCSIEELSLVGGGMGPAGAAMLGESLGGCQALKEMRAACNRMGPEGGLGLATGLRSNSALLRLDICRNGLGPSGGSALGEALRHNCTLQWLDVSHNELGVEGGTALFGALMVNRGLRYVDCMTNGFGSGCVGAIAQMLEVNCSLKNLRIGDNAFDANAGEILAPSLWKTSLWVLSLRFTPVGVGGCKAVCDTVQGESKLIALDFSGTELGSDGGQVLATALLASHDFRLLILEIGYNRLGPEGTRHVANYLVSGSILQTLVINNNELGIAGCGHMAEALSRNPTLCTVNMSMNRIGPEGGRLLALQLRGNDVLTVLDVRYNGFSSDDELLLARWNRCAGQRDADESYCLSLF